MTAFTDTNVLIRHLTGDPPDLAARATALLATADELLLADLIVAETVHVLESFYEVPNWPSSLHARHSALSGSPPRMPLKMCRSALLAMCSFLRRHG